MICIKMSNRLAGKWRLWCVSYCRCLATNRRSLKHSSSQLTPLCFYSTLIDSAASLFKPFENFYISQSWNTYLFFSYQFRVLFLRLAHKEYCFWTMNGKNLKNSSESVILNWYSKSALILKCVCWRGNKTETKYTKITSQITQTTIIK